MNTSTVGLNRTPSTALFKGRHTDDASRLASRNYTPASTPFTASRTFHFEDDQSQRPAPSRAFKEDNAGIRPENRRLSVESSAQSVSDRLIMLQRFAMTGTVATVQFAKDGEGEEPKYQQHADSTRRDKSEYLHTEACNDSEKDNIVDLFTYSSASTKVASVTSSAPTPTTVVVVRLTDLSAELKEAFISELLVEADDASIAFAKGPASQMIANVSIGRGAENNNTRDRNEERSQHGIISTLRVLELVEMASREKSEQQAQRMREGRTLLEEAREELLINQRRNQQPTSSSIPTATGSRRVSHAIKPQNDHHQVVNDVPSSQSTTTSTKFRFDSMHHFSPNRTTSIIEESQRVLLESSAILAGRVHADNKHCEREFSTRDTDRRAAGTDIYDRYGFDGHQYGNQITRLYHQRNRAEYAEASEQRGEEQKEEEVEENEGPHDEARRPKHDAGAVFISDEVMPTPIPMPAPTPTPHNDAHYVSPKRQHYYHPQQHEQEHASHHLRRDRALPNNVTRAEAKLGLRVPTAAEKARAAAKEAREMYELPASFLNGGKTKEETSLISGEKDVSEDGRQSNRGQDVSKKHPLSPSRQRQETRPNCETVGRVTKGVTSSITARNPIPLRSSSGSRPNSRSRTRDPTPTRRPSPRPQAQGEERSSSSARQTSTPVPTTDEDRRSVSATRRNFAADVSTISVAHSKASPNDGTQLPGLKLSAEDKERHARAATTRTAAWLAKQADEIFTLIHKTVLPPREKLNDILKREERRLGLRLQQFMSENNNNNASCAAGNRSRLGELRGGERGRGESKGRPSSCLLHVSPQPPTLFSAVIRHIISARCGIDSVVGSTIDELAHNAHKFSKVCPTANILHYFFETCRDDDILEQLLLFIAMRQKALPFASSESQKVTAQAVPLPLTLEVGDATEAEVTRVYTLEPLTVAEHSARYGAVGRSYNSGKDQLQQHLIMRRYVPLGKVPAAVKAMLEDLQPQPFSSSQRTAAAGTLVPPSSGNVSTNNTVLAAASKEIGGGSITPSRQRTHNTSVDVPNSTTNTSVNFTQANTFVVTSPFRDRQPFLYPSSVSDSLIPQHFNANGSSSSSSAFFMNTTIVSSNQPQQQQQQMAVPKSSEQSSTRLRVTANGDMNNISVDNNNVVAEEGNSAAVMMKQRVSAIKASIASWISDELRIVEKSKRIVEMYREVRQGRERGGGHAENEEALAFASLGENEVPSIAFDLVGHVDAIELVRAVVAERLNKWSGSGDVQGQQKEEEPATATAANVTNDGAAYSVSEPHPSTSPLLRQPGGNSNLKGDHQVVEAKESFQNTYTSRNEKEEGDHPFYLVDSSRSVSERRAIEKAKAVTRERFLPHSYIPLTKLNDKTEKTNANEYGNEYMFKEGSQQQRMLSPQREHSRSQSPARTHIIISERLQNSARSRSTLADPPRDLSSFNTTARPPQRFTQALTAANDVSPPPLALPNLKTDKMSSAIVGPTNPILADAQSMQALRSELRRAQSVLNCEPSSSSYSHASGPTLPRPTQTQTKSQSAALPGDDGPSLSSSTQRPSPAPERRTEPSAPDQRSLSNSKTSTKEIREKHRGALAEEDAAQRTIGTKEEQDLAKLINENNLFGTFSANRKTNVDVLHVEREGESSALSSLAAGVPSVRRTVSISPHRDVTEYKTTDRPADLHSQQQRQQQERGPRYAGYSGTSPHHNDESPDAKKDFAYSAHNEWRPQAKKTENVSLGSQRSPEAEPQKAAGIDHRAHGHVDENDHAKRYNESTPSTHQYSFLDRHFYQRPLSPSASQPSGGRVPSSSLAFSREDENGAPERRQSSGERWRGVTRAGGEEVNYPSISTAFKLSARDGSRSQSRVNFDDFATEQYAYERKGSVSTGGGGVGDASAMRQPSSYLYHRRRSSPPSSDRYYSNPYEHFASISPYH